MVGSVAQIVAITCHGNAFLQGMGTGKFFPDNSTFKFCEFVNFVVLEKRFFRNTREVVVAKTPQEWFGLLKASEAQGIRLVHGPSGDPRAEDRKTEAFVGGGALWCLEVEFPRDRRACWFPRWVVGNQDAPDQRIWRVNYGRLIDGHAQVNRLDPLDAVTDRFVAALGEIHAFSESQNCEGFTQCFADALDAIASGGRNVYGYHKDLIPQGFRSGKALAVLDACQRAWVFGGMGSWNDMGFPGVLGEEYERVSEQLYRCLKDAIAVASNETFLRGTASA